MRLGEGPVRERRETGKEQMVQVHYGEGVAIHIGPESCAGGREAVREAFTGEHAGQPLSRERDAFRVPTFFLCAEGKMSRRDSARAGSTRRGQSPWHAWTLLVREPGALGIGQSARQGWSAS